MKNIERTMRITVLVPLVAAVLAAANVASVDRREPEAKVVACDRAIWEAFKTKDVAALRALLAEDYREIRAGGILNKAETMELVKDLDIDEFAISDRTVTFVADDVALLTYKIRIKGKSKGVGFESTSWYGMMFIARESVWRQFFCQQTRAASRDPQKKG